MVNNVNTVTTRLYYIGSRKVFVSSPEKPPAEEVNKSDPEPPRNRLFKSKISPKQQQKPN